MAEKHEYDELLTQLDATHKYRPYPQSALAKRAYDAIRELQDKLAVERDEHIETGKRKREIAEAAEARLATVFKAVDQMKEWAHQIAHDFDAIRAIAPASEATESAAKAEIRSTTADLVSDSPTPALAADPIPGPAPFDVDDWMGRYDIVLSRDAYAELKRIVAAQIRPAREEGGAVNSLAHDSAPAATYIPGLEMAVEIAAGIRYKCKSISDGTTAADPDHVRFTHQATGADECDYAIRAEIARLRREGK